MAEGEHTPQTATVAGLLAAAAEGQGGALWRLRGAGRQLDANLVRHLPGTGGAPSTENAVDVVMVVVAGTGVLTLDGEQSHLSPGFLGLLPRGAVRALLAGPQGLVVLTVHRRRRGMSIAPAATALPAEPPVAALAEPPPTCALHLVCAHCHRHAIEVDARFCSGCGTPLTGGPAGGG
ncbi:hypothetical protein [Streptomyces sp. NPDC001594]|uniref:hypothetical protein n=1 Tax=Streptomyces sp. NPDC001594 TaxID=3364590 RepID=UPI003695EC4C